MGVRAVVSPSQECLVCTTEPFGLWSKPHSAESYGLCLRPRVSYDHTMLVGRDAECAEIRRLVSKVRSEGGPSDKVLVIRGDPGIGKTALLDFAAEIADGMRVLSVRGLESGTDSESEVSFVGLADLLRPITSLLRDLSAD